MSTMPKWPTRLLNHIILSLRIVQIIGVAGFLGFARTVFRV